MLERWPEGMQVQRRRIEMDMKEGAIIGNDRLSCYYKQQLEVGGGRSLELDNIITKRPQVLERPSVWTPKTSGFSKNQRETDARLNEHCTVSRALRVKPSM
jgi:hypothetical protein